jgi:hypothetical protein
LREICYDVLVCHLLEYSSDSWDSYSLIILLLIIHFNCLYCFSYLSVSQIIVMNVVMNLV